MKKRVNMEQLASGLNKQKVIEKVGSCSNNLAAAVAGGPSGCLSCFATCQAPAS